MQHGNSAQIYVYILIILWIKEEGGFIVQLCAVLDLVV